MMVVPAPPLLWGGCDDPGTIRSVFDVNSWLVSLPGYPLKAAAQTVLSDLRGGTAAVQAAYNNRLVLPASLAFRSLQSFVSKGPADLRSGVGPLSVERESLFIHALIADLNKNMCLNIDPLPDLNRDTELPAVSTPLIMVGGSHASRMASLMDDRLPSFTRGGWRVGKTAVEGLAHDLAEAKASFPCEAVVVLQLFDNISYYTITSEDTIIPCRKDVTGRYHVDGDLLMAPPEMISPYIRNCIPIMNELENIPKIILSPLPRYLTRSCCPDPEHAPNRGEEGFRKKIISGAERLRKSIRDQLLESGVRNFKVYNPLWLIAGPKTSDEALHRLIDDLWDEDPVHPSPTGYKRLLAAIGLLAASVRDTGKAGAASKTPSNVGGWPEWLPTHPQSHGTWARGGTRGRWPRGGKRGRPHPSGLRGRGGFAGRGQQWPY
jgi:hypothetical protein